ncbi:MAG: hypothetical protein EOO63_06085 [Hymenobacter sp.]|nr:MAG: hypothetical protein EOO63_06085 [Hymenobacter sp.]
MASGLAVFFVRTLVGALVGFGNGPDNLVDEQGLVGVGEDDYPLAFVAVDHELARETFVPAAMLEVYVPLLGA